MPATAHPFPIADVTSRDVILAIDAGGTFFKSALIAPDGQILFGTLPSVPVNSQGKAEEIIGAYVATFVSAFEQADTNGLRVASIGISTPGPFGYARCTSLMTHKFQAIRGLDLRQALDNVYPKTRYVPLRFLHDVHAFVLGEYRCGAARGYERVIGVTLGTGVGFGCVCEGRIRDNGEGGPWASIFQKPCRDGILEDYVSRCGIIRMYHACRERTQSQGGKAVLAPAPESESAHVGLDVADIAALAGGGGEGDAAARAAFECAGHALGETLAPIVRELSATCLVLGGQISKSFQLFGPALREALAGCDSLQRVTSAMYPDTSALCGAAFASVA